MKKLILLLAALLLPGTSLLAQSEKLTEHALKTFEIFRTIVEIDTSKTKGNTPRVAQFLADELIAAGFPENDVEIVRRGDLAALVVRYRGSGSSGEKPILFLGHMDVVTWTARAQPLPITSRQPRKLTQPGRSPSAIQVVIVRALEKTTPFMISPRPSVTSRISNSRCATAT